MKPRADKDTNDELWSELHGAIHELALRALNGRSGQADLRPTVVVNEAYARLSGWCSEHGYQDKAHFLAVAARAVREVLVDYSRRRHADKRGEGWARITLSGLLADDRDPLDLIALDDALHTLASSNPRAARVVELRFFGGLTHREVAETIGVSLRTVNLDWRLARAWLLRELDA